MANERINELNRSSAQMVEIVEGEAYFIELYSNLNLLLQLLLETQISLKILQRLLLLLISVSVNFDLVIIIL